MSDERLEELLAEYAERLESAAGPPQAPEAFALERGVRSPSALEALRRLAETDALFSDAVDAPRRVGPYRVLDVLGRGGVGVVYRAVRDDAPDDAVALKLLALPGRANPRAVERFRREIRALARVAHPGVVRIREAGETEDGAYVAMDLVPGTPLSELRGQDARRAAELVAALARAVAAVHAAGVVHRDLKPSNVVVRADGAPVLLDFGLAAAEDATTLTATGDVVGTPAYMAPEQAAGREADGRSDVYALGAILHDALTGAPPHGRLEPAALIAMLRTHPAPPLRESNADVDPTLAAIADRALSFDPAARYPTAEALADDLEAWLAGRPTDARPPSTVERARRALRRRRRGVAVLLVVVLAGVAGAVASRALRRDADAGREIPSAAALAAAFEEACAAYLDDDGPKAAAAARRLLAARADDVGAAVLLAAAQGTPAETAAAPEWHAFLEGERRRIAGDHHGAFQFVDRAARLAPDVGLFQHRLGLVAASTDRPDLAVRAFDRAARALPNSSRAARDLAAALEKRKEFAEAARNYAAAVERKPDDGDLWYRLARAQFMAGDLDAARRSAATALERLGEDGLRAYVLFGVVLGANGRFAEAHAAYDAALLRRPDYASAHYNKGVAYDSEHRVAEAEASYLAAIAAAPDDARSMIVLANLYSGASSDVCEGCRAAYALHPQCRDDAKARDFALRALARSRGADAAITDLVATIARRAGAIPETLAAIDSLRTARSSESAPTSRAADRRTAALANLDRAAAALRAPAAPR
ncbi:MAG TPA: serine/threonine-protein kinase [Planctomycetota bacterium]|nr:serine/threonine-protein kinase [Planctomycetota bacterium]